MSSLNMTITTFLQTEIILKSSSNVGDHNNVNSSKYAYICRKPCFKNSPTLILWIQKFNSIKYNSSSIGKLFLEIPLRQILLTLTKYYEMYICQIPETVKN
jgi:hypothetical protein